jgi:hypothetical protein
MVKPDLVAVYANPNGRLFKLKGKGLEPMGPIPLVQRLLLKRTGSLFEAHTPLDLLDPGVEWKKFGSPLEIFNEEDLLVNIKVYRNGQLLTVNNDFGSDFDFYFVDTNKIAFVFSIRTHEILQISRNFEE